VPGPIDIVGLDGMGVHGGTRRIGALDADLSAAIRFALTADRAACAEEGARYDWDTCTDRFLDGLEWRHGSRRAATAAKAAETLARATESV
jgi:hypothetical protein